MPKTKKAASNLIDEYINKVIEYQRKMLRDLKYSGDISKLDRKDASAIIDDDLVRERDAKRTRNSNNSAAAVSTAVY